MGDLTWEDDDVDAMMRHLDSQFTPHDPWPSASHYVKVGEPPRNPPADGESSNAR